MNKKFDTKGKCTDRFECHFSIATAPNSLETITNGPTIENLLKLIQLLFAIHFFKSHKNDSRKMIYFH